MGKGKTSLRTAFLLRELLLRLSRFLLRRHVLIPLLLVLSVGYSLYLVLSYHFYTTYEIEPGSPLRIIRTRTTPSYLVQVLDWESDLMISEHLRREGCWEPFVEVAFERILKGRCEMTDDGNRKGRGRRHGNRNSAIVVDVGLNLGVFGLYAASLGCRVVGFEVQELLVEYARNSAKWNGFEGRFTVERFAVASSSGQFHSVVRNGRANAGAVSAVPVTSMKRIHDLTLDDSPDTLRSVSLDDYFLPEVEEAEAEKREDDESLDREQEPNPNWSIALLKIDVEGHEMEVLKGSTELFQLGIVENVIVEISISHIEDVIESMISLGFVKLEILQEAEWPYYYFVRARPSIVILLDQESEYLVKLRKVVQVYGKRRVNKMDVVFSIA